MSKYEIMFIVKTTIDDAAIKDTISTVKSVITDSKGKIFEERDMGRRELAYPINKELSGFYHVFKCEASTEAVAEFERRTKLNENIIRHLILKLDEE